MSLLEPSLIPTAASAQAIRNWHANFDALAIAQPWVIETMESTELCVTWVFGRDGFLTAQDEQGQWWAGCSLPKRAGQTMLKKLAINGVVGCFLAPSHAGQVVVALEKLSHQQAVVVVQSDLQAMRVMLGCCDFSDSIRQGRLWFAIGEAWAGMLAELFASQPGLPTPCQFIRTPATSEEVVQQIIPVAERVFKESNAMRAARIAQLQSSEQERLPSTSGKAPKLLLAAGTHFRLWDDAGAALVAAFMPHPHWNPDAPAQSSALGLAMAAVDCDAVVVPHRSRAELPEVLSASTAVISWIVQPRIPAFNPKFPKDALLLADENWLAVAQNAGWPADRLGVAGWPFLDLPAAAEKCLAMISNVGSLETPVTKLDASSHHLLWEMIRADLSVDPFSLGNDVNGFIDRRRAKLGISEEGLDRGLFIDQLIVPAYQQALAKLLIDAGVPLKLFGVGWDELPGLRSHWQGRVETREQFEAAVTGAAALVYCWPLRYHHEMDRLNRPVLAPSSRTAEHWIREARKIVAKIPTPMQKAEAISRRQIEWLIR